MSALHHFRCPDCGRLESVLWDAAWCMHHERCLPSPPEWIGTDWARMLPVTDVQTGELPPEADEWYVGESRNPYGYPNDEIPGEDKRGWRIVGGPFTREDAYAFAETQPRDDVPSYIHNFRPVPGDMKR